MKQKMENNNGNSTTSKNHKIEEKILGEFEICIFNTATVLNEMLIPSKSWRKNEIDIRTNRFIIACRDFVFTVNKYLESKIELPSCLLNPLALIGTEILRVYPRKDDMIRKQEFGEISCELTKACHQEISRATNNTILKLDRLCSFIRTNYDYLLHQPLCEELSWVIICLKQARCMFRYTAIQDLGKDGETIYEPKSLKKEIENE